MPTLLLLAIILVAAYLVRTHDFAGLWIWQDELMTLHQVHQRYYETTADAPLYPAVLRISCYLTGSCLIDDLRIFTILTGLLLPIAVFLLTKRLDGTRAAFRAAILCAFLEYFIAHSINLRPYTLFMLVSCAVYLAFFGLLKGKRNYLLLGSSLVLCSLTHLLSSQIYLSIFGTSLICWFLARQRDRVIPNGLASSRKFVACASILAGAALLGNLWVPERLIPSFQLRLKRERILLRLRCSG